MILFRFLYLPQITTLNIVFLSEHFKLSFLRWSVKHDMKPNHVTHSTCTARCSFARMLKLACTTDKLLFIVFDSRLQIHFILLFVVLYLEISRLDNENRSRILGLLEAGISRFEAARRFNISRSTIVRLVRRVGQIGTVSGRLRPSAPRVTS